MTRPEVFPSSEYKQLIVTGDIFITVMGYLNEVTAGGGTAFDHPLAEQLIEPSKGAVAVWFNLDTSGHLQFEASHGGCPVLLGSKWIFNKWIYYFDQWKAYPCSLQPNKMSQLSTD